MHLSLTFISLFGFSLHAKAQALNSTGLVDSLRQAGLTTLAGAVQRANQSDAGQRLLSALSDNTRNYTMFAPDNAAFQTRTANAIGDSPDELANVLSYHVLYGNFDNSSDSAMSLDSSVLPLVTVGRTLLTNSSLVNLEGGKGQVLVWSRNASSNSPVFFLNQFPRGIVRNTTSISNFLIAVISNILSPPGNLTEVIGENNLAELARLLSLVSIPNFFSNGTNATITEALEANNTRGFTLFAPNDAALRNAGTELTNMASNQTGLLALLGNHLINGTSYYSPTLLESSPSTSFISDSGQAFSFSTNATGAYVTSGNSTVKILKSDVLVRNGVMHVIDGVLLNTDVDQQKGDAAYQSATSAAGQQITETGPIGPVATASSGNGSRGGTSGGKSNGAVDIFRTAKAGLGGGGIVGAGVAGVLGWLAFCWLG